MPQTNSQMLTQLCKDVASLISLIRGDPDDHEDMGLIGDVHNNTKFRKDVTKFKWYFIVTILALCGTIIAQTLI